MTLQERRHDRLAVRLSLIISRLVSGETLFIRKLATEFGVSERTLRRDFRERLMYLDLDYYQGQCSLRSDIHSTRQEIDILTFAHRTGLAGVFPGFDRRLVSSLLDCDDRPCLVWHQDRPHPPAGKLCFYRLVRAISGCQRITVLTEGERHEAVAPYRLIALDGYWYLVAEHNRQLRVFRLDEIRLVRPSRETFIRSELLYQLSEDKHFISALPHFRFIQQSLNSISPSESRGQSGQTD
ncbi:TPA: WYL domain-containing protein [Klebsiella michiganensis]|uniref:helix-turn-helix transcriptional regulator n=1 Tax=Enterobacteriaceae TaxID=543 RepID=UPI00277CBE18|nr:WYL domain-containing protein [Klebsiella michiganensis]HDX8781744.1 WYL domain-containing protein [Klebsiella michiganensis]HDX9065088.1 WYL domain-containing protein [Klebsiella michiganensis]